MSGTLRNIVIFLMLLIGCSDKSSVKDYQLKIINDYLQGDLRYEYYKDSTVKEAYKINSLGQRQGRTLEFSPKGLLSRIYFINNEGDTVGDESIFNDSGNLSEHLFRLNSEKLLFYAEFSEDGKFRYADGSPFFLHGRSKITKNDTIPFYIAAPIIPGFQTKVTFGQNGDPESQVNYINDLRQFTYRKVMPDKGEFEFILHVQIIDNTDKIIVEDFDTTKVTVND